MAGDGAFIWWSLNLGFGSCFVMFLSLLFQPVSSVLTSQKQTMSKEHPLQIVAQRELGFTIKLNKGVSLSLVSP